MNQLTFSALAEPSRFQIVELLLHQPHSVNEIVDRLHMRQPQVSKHLKVLADAGVVEMHPVAQQRIYELSPKKFQELDTWISRYKKLWEERFSRLDELLEREKRRSASGGKGGEKK